MTLTNHSSGEPDDAAQCDATLAFRQLEPLRLLDAIDAAGYRTDGRVSALNSYENRVYAIGLEDGSSVVAKFYRPARWSDAAIEEEHHFCARLVERELPVVAPLMAADGRTLLQTGPFRFCLFERVGGRPPELDDPEQLLVIGRTLGRMHAVGRTITFQHRPQVDAARLGDESITFLLSSERLPADSRSAYEPLARQLLDTVHARLADCPGLQPLSIHGDFHPGNMLWGRDATPQVLDFDDTATGPAVQDLWMFVSGDRAYAQAQLGSLLDGYLEFHDFDLRELALIEPLRTLRILHYAAWIARRWEDPAFQQAFPHFAGRRFWDEHILTLREQLVALDEPPLRY